MSRRHARLIVDGGNFDWEAHAERFPLLNKPDPSYHGAVWTEAVKPLGPIAYGLKARVTLLRDLGAAMSPFNAFQFIQGLETLPLRIREHSRNGQQVAEWLRDRPEVARVIYPSLHEDAEQRWRAETYLKGGFGGLVGFELKDGIEATAPSSTGSSSCTTWLTLVTRGAWRFIRPPPPTRSERRKNCRPPARRRATSAFPSASSTSTTSSPISTAGSPPQPRRAGNLERGAGHCAPSYLERARRA